MTGPVRPGQNRSNEVQSLLELDGCRTAPPPPLRLRLTSEVAVASVSFRSLTGPATGRPLARGVIFNRYEPTPKTGRRCPANVVHSNAGRGCQAGSTLFVGSVAVAEATNDRPNDDLRLR